VFYFCQFIGADASAHRALCPALFSVTYCLQFCTLVIQQINDDDDDDNNNNNIFICIYCSTNAGLKNIRHAGQCIGL